jgi:gas vesicle protein
MSRDDVPGTITTFVLGIIVGAVATLLLAPKSGEELRADLAEVLSGAANRVSTTGKSLKKRGKVLVNLAKDKVQDAVEAGEEAYRQAKKS